MTVQLAPATGPRGRVARYLAPLAVAIAAAAAIAVVLSAPGQSGQQAGAARVPHAIARTPPPYWIVRPGDTFALIAAKTGVSVAQVQAFNPDVDPLGLVPGQRLQAVAASAQAIPQADAARTAVLDGAPWRIVRLDRRQDRHQHTHPQATEPAAEADHPMARRPGKAPSPAAGIQPPGTSGGRLAAEHTQLVTTVSTTPDSG